VEEFIRLASRRPQPTGLAKGRDEQAGRRLRIYRQHAERGACRPGWLDGLACLPRFDSDACFAALVGTQEHGFWRLRPAGGEYRVSRRYLPHAPILETTFETEGGKVTLVDFMPLSDDPELVDVIRLVRGVSGRVVMRMELALRFGYGKSIPWVRRRDYGIHAVAGPDAVELVTTVPPVRHWHAYRSRVRGERGVCRPFHARLSSAVW
jgi:hypothetical protein